MREPLQRRSRPPAPPASRTDRRAAPRCARLGTADDPEPSPTSSRNIGNDERTRVLSGLVAAMLALAVGLGGVVYTLVQQRQAQIAQTNLEQQLYAARTPHR